MTLSKKQRASYEKKKIAIGATGKAKQLRRRPQPFACIEHPNCTCYGFHRPECQRVHLASETVIHVRTILEARLAA